MKKLNIPQRNPQPACAQRRPEEIELTKALKMVVDAFTDLGFEDFYILGLVNLIINEHIMANGEFTEEYKKYAALAMKNSQAPESPGIITIIP